MKLISHLDPSQLRLGYLTCLALVAGRQLDTKQGLVDRLTRFLFQSIDARDRRWPKFMERTSDHELRRLTPPPDEKSVALNEIFRVNAPAVPTFPLQVLWMAQRHLSSNLGLLAVKNAEHILKMARSFEILTTGYALSEKGVFLQNYSMQILPGIQDGDPNANPFDVSVRPALRLFFLYTLLSVDILTPFLLREFAGQAQGDLPNAPVLIGNAADRLVEAIAPRTDISNIELVRESRTFAERLATKGVAKNQAQPRYYHLFELGLVERVESDLDGRRIVPYLANEACHRAVRSLGPLLERPEDQQDLLDCNFFHWAADIYGQPFRPCVDELRRLLYFARGFNYLQREIGFTPGRTIALAGCLLAWEEGWIVEVDEMFQLLRNVAAGPWRPFLEYSGGSRLDQEFLIKIKPGLIPALEKKLT